MSTRLLSRVISRYAQSGRCGVAQRMMTACLSFLWRQQYWMAPVLFFGPSLGLEEYPIYLHRAPYIISLICVSPPGLQSTVCMHLTMQCRNILVLGTFLPSTKPVTFGVKAEWNTMFLASNYFLCIKHRIFIYYHHWNKETKLWILLFKQLQTNFDLLYCRKKEKKLSCVVN